MKKKKVLIPLFILVLLASSFFWSGNDQDSRKPKIAEETITTKLVSNEQIAEEQKNDLAEAENVVEKSDQQVEAALIEEGKKEGKEEESTPPGAVEVEGQIEQTIAEDTSKKPDENSKKEVPQKTKQDKYLTDSVPEGKPKPVEWQDTTINTAKKLTATLSVSSKTILDNMNKFNQDKMEVLPEDGIIYAQQEITFYEGESVFDVLLREMKQNNIHMEFEMTPIYNSSYIEGIHNLYEFDCGELSGWMYKVNGWFPNYGCSRYLLQEGDKIEWVYTCDLGRDVGGFYAMGGGE